jgi:hypothetical protein
VASIARQVASRRGVVDQAFSVQCAEFRFEGVHRTTVRRA